MASRTEDASRKSSSFDVPEHVLSSWLDVQVGLVDQSKHQVMTLVGLAHRVHRCGGNPGNLPFCYSGGEMVSRADVGRRISTAGEVYLLLVKNVVESLNWLSFKSISVALLTDRIKPQAVAATLDDAEAFGQELGQWILRRLPVPIDVRQIPIEAASKNPVLEVALNELGSDCQANVCYVNTSAVDLDIAAPQRLALVLRSKHLSAGSPQTVGDRA